MTLETWTNSIDYHRERQLRQRDTDRRTTKRLAKLLGLDVEGATAYIRRLVGREAINPTTPAAAIVAAALDDQDAAEQLTAALVDRLLPAFIETIHEVLKEGAFNADSQSKGTCPQTCQRCQERLEVPAPVPPVEIERGDAYEGE